MARKRYWDEDILKLLREIEVHLHDGMDVISACRKAGVSDKTYYGWRKKFGGMNRAQLSEMRSLEKEKQRLQKIVTDLELNKLILKESLCYLKPPCLSAELECHFDRITQIVHRPYAEYVENK